MSSSIHTEAEPLTAAAESIELRENGNIPHHDVKPADTDKLLGVDDVLKKIGCGLFQVLAYLLAALSFFAFSSRNYLTFAFVNLEISRQWNLDGLEASIMPALSCIGVLMGSLTMGIASDRFGRVWPYAVFAFGLGVVVLASAFSPNFYFFLFFRMLAGFFLGGTQLVVYPTLLEFLPIDKRGQIATLVMFNQSIGSSLAAVLAWYLIATYTTIGWRLYIIVTAIPCLLLGVYRLVFFFESPRYLVSRGKIEKAWLVFGRMAKINRKNLQEIASIENFEAHVNNSDTFLSHIKKIPRLFKKPFLWHTLSVSIASPVTRSVIFANSLMFLSVLLQNLGVNPYMGLVIGSVSQIPGLLLMSIITEWPWFGRLNTFRLFAVLAAVSYFLFAFIQNEITIPIFTVFIFFSVAPMTSMVFTYISESYPTDVRATAASFIDAWAGLLGIATSLTAGYLADLSSRYSWLFPTVTGVACVIVLIDSFLLKIEPRGKELEDSIVNHN